jgi:hypothetical protein
MLTFMVALATGEQQVAFWYTEMVPREWLFDQFKAAIGLR